MATLQSPETLVARKPLPSSDITDIPPVRSIGAWEYLWHCAGTINKDPSLHNGPRPSGPAS